MLETKDRFLKVGQQLVLGPHAHDPLFVAEPHHWGRVAEAVVIGDTLDTSGSGYAYVAGQITKVYTHNSHDGLE